MTNIKAVALVSGGLDSLLAAKLIAMQGIEVHVVHFQSYFFSSKLSSRISYIKQLNLPIKIIDITKKQLDVIKNNVYGFGKALNPCIDCHAMQIKTAKEYLDEIGGHFIITGEVLGQRPKSQRKEALRMVDKLTFLGDITLRPLSAKLLEPTLPEREGWVDREKLLDIKGRSRERQMKLAEEFGLNYPSPGGGCLLTEVGYSKKLKELLDNTTYRDIEPFDIFLLKLGRHLRVPGMGKIILSRTEEEGKLFYHTIFKKNKDKLFFVKSLNNKGPVALLEKIYDNNFLTSALSILYFYGKKYSQDVLTVIQLDDNLNEKEIFRIETKNLPQITEKDFIFVSNWSLR